VPLRSFALISTFALALPMSAAAQDFGVLNSAETINRGNVKLLLNPMVLLEDDREDDLGLGMSLGYGLTDRFDIEGRVALFDGVTFVGGDAEYWVVKNAPLDVSVAGGFHVSRSDGFDTRGVDLTFLGSGHVQPRLELFTALDIALNAVDDDPLDRDFTTVHLVPGIEAAITPDLDFVAEVGLGVSDDSAHYFSAGLAFYFR
jgi:hypothetical protein